MTCFNVAINGVMPTMQPDTAEWVEPALFGDDGNGLPVRAPFYACVLGFSRTSTVQFEEWYKHLGTKVDMHLPLPRTHRRVEVTDVVVHSIEQRLDISDPSVVASTGVDITIRRIDLSTWL